MEHFIAPEFLIGVSMPTVDNLTRLFISVSSRPGTMGARVYNYLFDRYGINAVYLPRLAPKDPRDLVSTIRTLGIAGCSVSMPLKTRVIELLDSVDQAARETRSVNTIVNRDGSLCGFNTDYPGIRDVLTPCMPRRALIWGSGGVVGSVALALKDLGASEIAISGRNSEAVSSAARNYELTPLSIGEVLSRKQSFDILVNATPAGWQDNDLGPLADLVPLSETIFDLIPSDAESALVQLSRSAAKPVLRGIDMFKAQVRHQFEIYTGRSAYTEDIELALAK
jgi:shikimate dehydrogenase